PSKSHAFRSDTLFYAPSIMVVAILVIPFFVILLLYLQSVTRANISKEELILNERSFFKRIKYILLIGFALVVGVGIFYFYKNPHFIEADIVDYRTLIPPKWIIILASATLILIVFNIFVFRRKQTLLIIIIVISNILLFSISERAISQIDYFKYQLGDQRILFLAESFTIKVVYIPILFGVIISLYFLNKKLNVSKINIFITYVVIALFLIQSTLISEKEKYSRNVLCFDLGSGKEIWKNSVAKDIESELHNHNSLATPTSIILNNHIISYFGNCGLSCVDKTSG
ncbi:unnamed protein product, partial [marine sediment metagenome]